MSTNTYLTNALRLMVAHFNEPFTDGQRDALRQAKQALSEAEAGKFARIVKHVNMFLTLEEADAFAMEKVYLPHVTEVSIKRVGLQSWSVTWLANE